jgi:tetratricopeptide (TPR) repeat protein
VRDSSLARSVAEGISKKELSPRGVCTFYRGQAFTFLTTDPGHSLELLVKKISLILSGHESHPDGSLYFERRFSTLLSVLVWDKIVAFPMGILIPFCVVGLIVTASSWRRLMLLYAFTLSAALVPLLLYVNIETRAVLMFAVMIFASAGLFEIIARIAKGEFQKLIVPIVALLVFLFIANFKFVKLDEDYATEFLRLGTIAWSEGDTANAERMYIEGLQYNDDSPTLLNGLGNIYYRQGIYQEAEKKYRRALNARPDFFDARKNLILTLEKEHGEGTLNDYYAELLSYYPNSPFGLKRMAEYYLGEGLNDSAAVYYKRWAEVEPDNPDAEFGLGNALTRLGKGEEARKIYERLVYKYPEEPTVHLNLGIVYMQLGLDNLAEEEFESVLYYDTNSTYALYNLAQMYDSRGDSAMAQNLYMKILTVDPDFYADPEAIIDSLMQYAIPADSL